MLIKSYKIFTKAIEDRLNSMKDYRSKIEAKYDTVEYNSYYRNTIWAMWDLVSKAYTNIADCPFEDAVKRKVQSELDKLLDDIFIEIMKF